MSLIGRAPSVIPSTLCKLVVVSPNNSSEPKESLIVQSNDAASGDDGQSITGEKTREKANFYFYFFSISIFFFFFLDEESSEFVMQEIIRFIDMLNARKFLSASQTRLLSELLLENRFFPQFIISSNFKVNPNLFFLVHFCLRRIQWR
jgi:hypothetical protein